MQTAKSNQTGAIYNAPSFGCLSPDELAQIRGLLSCPGCQGHSYYRREARNGRAPCFCAHHDPDCEYAAASPMTRSGATGLGRISPGVLDRPIVLDFSYGSVDDEGHEMAGTPAPSSKAVKQSGEMHAESSTFSSHRRLSTMLRNLLETPDFVQSPQTLYVQGIGQTRVCDFFVNFKQLGQAQLGQLKGYWGALTSVGQGNSSELWLNTGNDGSRDLSICVPARLVNALYERYAIHLGSAWEQGSCFALAVGVVHLSRRGKPYIEVADLCNLTIHRRGTQLDGGD